MYIQGQCYRVGEAGDRPGRQTSRGRAHGPECHGILVPQLVTHI
jgi:hypothetical protein